MSVGDTYINIIVGSSAPWMYPDLDPDLDVSAANPPTKKKNRCL